MTTRSRARAAVLRRGRDNLPWLPWFVLLGLLLAGFAFQAAAQTMGTKPNPDSSGPQLAVPHEGRGDGTPDDAPGSDRGLVRPPRAVDPGIHTAPPAPGSAGTMPVIPPPGTPGGNQQVQPR